MAQTDYTNIPVLKETKTTLLKQKLLKQGKEGRAITWDEFLLKAVE